MSANGDAEESSSKRRRVARACTSCRAKKSRCDGAFPRCSPCTSLDYECQYDGKSGPGVTNVIVTRDYLSSLEDRITRLERRDEERNFLSDFAAPSSSSDGGPPQPSPSTSIRQILAPVPVPTPLIHPSPFPSDPHATTSPQAVDGMGALRFAPPATGGGDASDLEYFGDASGVSFHSLILQHFFLGPHPQAPPSSSSDPTTDSATHPRRAAPGVNPLLTGVISLADLPTPEVARGLFDYYFSHIHRLYPFLHEGSIRRSYEDFWESRHLEDVRSSFTLGSVTSQLALHCAVFAMADKLRAAPEKVTHLYYQTTQKLLAAQKVIPQDILQVQVLLLNALFMQGSDDPEESWNLLGMAIRRGYGMGLHRLLAPSRATPIERETRKRTWCACFTLDRLMTVSLDRPTAITTSTATYPLPIALPDEDPSLVDFFNTSTNLYRLLSDGPSDLAAFSFLTLTPSSLHAATTSLTLLESSFQNWLHTMPAQLQRHPSGPNSEEAIVLTLRSYTTRLLIHRPLLSEAIRASHVDAVVPVLPEPSDPEYVRALVLKQQAQSMVGKSLSTTLSTGVESILLLSQTQLTDTLSAGWYRLFYALNSFMSLAAVLTLDLSEYGQISTPREVIIDALHQGREIVYNLGQRYHLASAQRSVYILDQMLSIASLSPSSADAPFVPALSRDVSRAQSPSAINWDDLIQTMDLGMLPTFNFLDQGTNDPFAFLDGTLA